MIDDKSDLLLMSDSIRGKVPVLEDDEEVAISQYEDRFVIVSLDLYVEERRLVTGTLSAISKDDSITKVYIRLPLFEGFKLLQETFKTKSKCNCYYMNYLGHEAQFEGPFDVSCVRMDEIDRENKMCTLGFDLV